jgi:hypothetical protein
MAQVYSVRLFTAPSVSGGPTTVYVAPAGFRTIVRTLTIVWGNVTLSDLDAWVQLGDLTKIVRKAFTGGGSNPDVIGGHVLWVGHMALNPGDELQVQTADGTVDFAGSGYQLSLP